MTRPRAAALVATFDLLESLRSRKAVVLLLLYLVGALGSSAIFVRVLLAIQARLQERYGPALNAQALMESPAMERLFTELSGDPQTASALIAIPPLVLFYGWLSRLAVPLLVLLTSSDAISANIASGRVRYSLFRVDRASWAVGKLIGQTCLMSLGILVGGLGCWLMGVIWLDGMPVGSSALWMLRITGRSVVYCFAYLGVAMCASQLTRTNARARGLALLMMAFCWLGGSLLQIGAIERLAPEVIGALQKLFPNGHSLALWHPGLFERSTALAALLAIGLGYFALGFWRFSKRDA